MASTKLLSGGKKDIVADPSAPAKGLAAVAAKAAKAAKEAPAAPVAEAPTEEERAVDLTELDAPGLAALVKEMEIKTPKGWAKMTLEAKKAWLENEHGTEAAAEVAEAPATTTTKKPVAAKAEVPAVKYKTPAVEKAHVKISPDKAAKALNGTVITGPNEFASIIQYVENLDKDTARSLATSISESSGYAAFKLGGVLSRIQEESWYTPYPTFREYVESEGLTTKGYRDAAYMVQIYNDLSELNISYDRVAGVQWTKLRTISGVLTQDNIEHWVKLASKQTVIQLVQTVKNYKDKMKGKALTGPEDPMTTKVMTFKVHGDQDKTIQAALEKAKESANTKVATVALEYICIDFLGNSKASLVAQLQQVGLDKAIEAINAAFPDATLALEMPESAEEGAAAA